MAEIAADFMTSFYGIQVGALETQEFRTGVGAVLAGLFFGGDQRSEGRLYFVVVLPNGNVVEPRVQKSSCGQAVTGIRALLRFLVTKGVVRKGLERAVPSVRTWRHCSLPRHISPDEVRRVIEACDPATPAGIA